MDTSVCDECLHGICVNEHRPIIHVTHLNMTHSNHRPVTYQPVTGSSDSFLGFKTWTNLLRLCWLPAVAFLLGAWKGPCPRIWAWPQVAPFSYSESITSVPYNTTGAVALQVAYINYSKTVPRIHLEFCPHIYVGPKIAPTFWVLETPLIITGHSDSFSSFYFLFS